ncbi:Protein CBG05151 [Caenorhabditis briggsae]|uniref:Protein CBG05151 n=1 Tax=Caenorhabditis briggsae TaxID=6238 RepID=A8WZ56_CAEBR|nr:Protein CBG05151 [Caenorhabditis briggsae]CAP25666.2 Protein CBG05151 [Caenorhabditis briggsae]
MERVRRDERKAAEEEQRVLDRQIQSENERRINQLRKKADDRMTTMFGGPTSSGAATKDVSISDETGHVNLFQDLEREERKNLGSGNKEYEAEKAQEKREWESKMGIQVYFADGTNDLAKKKEWYEEMPLRRMGAEPKKRRHHRDSSEERRLEEEYDREKKQKLAKLRDERLKRERIEKGREYALLHPKEMEQKKKEEENERKNGKPRYNSQFNPEFFRK